MYECHNEAHRKGHRTEEARDKCLARQKRRRERKAKAKADEARREANLRNESVEAYVRRRFCVEGTQADRVASSLNKEYPKRTPPYNWTDPIKIHCEEHVRWPGPGAFEAFLEANPEIMLVSEFRKRAGASAEIAMER